MNYYCHVTRFTEIKTEEWMIEKLRWDLDFLFDCVKSILIHPVDAGKEKVQYDRSKSGAFHAFNTTVEQILKYERLTSFLKQKILPLKTMPQDRAVLSCDHHALLFTSFVRNLDIPIRARTDFTKYIIKGMLIPHWITEIYDQASMSWKFVDPERRIKLVKEDDFLFAGQAWQFFKGHPKSHIPSYSGLKGTQGLKYALISDWNCIFKNELLGYEWRLKWFHKEKPDIVRISYKNLDADQQRDVETLAELLHDPDNNWKQLWTLYKKHIHEPETTSPDFGNRILGSI